MNYIKPKKIEFSNLRIRTLSIIMGALIFQVSSVLGPLKPLDLALVSKAEGATPGTNQWEMQYPELNANWLTDIWADSDHNVFVVGTGVNGATIGHYDGQRWSTVETYLMEEPAGELMGIWGSSGSNIFAVGGTTGQSDGKVMILHYNGSSWSIMNADFPGCLLDVWGSGPNDVFAVGIEGLVIHWNGNSWTKMSLESALGSAASGKAQISLTSLPDLQGIWGDSPNNVFCLGLSLSSSQQVVTAILHYQNGQWSRVKELPSVWLFDIWGAPGGDIWAVGDHIFRYQGGTWQDATPADLQEGFYLNKIAGRSGSDIMAVGVVADLDTEKGLIIRYDGQAWRKDVRDICANLFSEPSTNMPTSPVEGASVSGEFRSAWVGQNNKALVVGGNYLYDYPPRGTILLYDGVSWSTRSAESYIGTCFQVWANSSQNALAVGGYVGDFDYMDDSTAEKLSRIFIARYDGQYWTQIQTQEYGVLRDIWGSTSQELFAVGGDVYIDDDGQMVTESQILHSTNGTDWTRMSDTQNFADFLEGVWGASSSDVFAVGESIYHFNGVKWSKMASPSSDSWGLGRTAGPLHSVWGSDSSHVFAVGDWAEDGGIEGGRATILRYNGQSWTFMNNDIQDKLFKVWGTSPSNVFARGNNRIYHCDGVSWSAMNCPQDYNYYDLWGTSPDNVFVTYDLAIEGQSKDDILYQNGILHYDGQSWTNMGFVPAYGPLLGIGGTSPRDLLVVGDLGTILHLKSEEQPWQQKIPLQQGWNLISFQVNACIYSLQQPPQDVPWPQGIELRQVQDLKTWLSDGVSSPIRDAVNPQEAGDWQRITSFDRKGAHLLDKNVPSFANTLTYFSAGYGYWIKMNRPGYLVLTGNMLPSSTSLHLQTGWNLVGPVSHDSCYYQQGSEPPCPLQETPPLSLISVSGPAVPAALSSINGKYLRVTGFDCKGAKLYDTQVPAFACTLRYFAPGFGYWIKMTQEGDLTLPPSSL